MFFVVFGVATVLCIALAVWAGNSQWSYENDCEVWIPSVAATLAVGFFITVIVGIFTYTGNLTYPAKFEANKAAVEYALEKESGDETKPMDGIEDFSITKHLMEVASSWNQSLAQKQYWNETWLCDCLYPDEVMDLEPIQ